MRRRVSARRRFQLRRGCLRFLFESCVVSRVHLRDAREQREHRRVFSAAAARSAPRARRQISRREKQRAVRRRETGQRPSAGAGQLRRRILIVLVEVGTLVGIDLHRHEETVQSRRNFRISVRRLVHHVAPVAPHRADVDHDRTIERPRQRERLRTPWLPSNRARRRLAQIHAGRRLQRSGGQRAGRICRETRSHTEDANERG